MEDNANHRYLHSIACEDEAVDISRTGTLWTAMANILTTLIGAVLFLPWPVAQIGWIAGPVAMIIFALVSLYSALLLVDCYQFPDLVSGPMRNCSYRDAVLVFLGEGKAWLCALAQYAVFYGICVTFTFTCAINVRVNILRVCWRIAFVVSTTGIAILFPLFNDVLGILGAVNFWPLVVYFPVEMHIAQNKIPRWTLKWTLLQILNFISFLVSVATVVGSIEGFVKDKAA